MSEVSEGAAVSGVTTNGLLYFDLLLGDMRIPNLRMKMQVVWVRVKGLHALLRYGEKRRWYLASGHGGYSTDM